MKIPKVWNRKNRILLKELVKTDFRLRYQNSVLGYLWTVLKPMMLFTILYIVFVQFLHIGNNIPHYAVYLLTGIVLWSFFSEATNQGLQSVLMRGDLLRKINFPKYIVVMAATVSALVNFAFNFVVIIIFAIINGVQFSWTIILVPVFILELYILALGLGFLLGAINVKFRDIASIWEVIMQGMFYAVPIIWPITMVSANSALFAKILLLNPVAQILQDVRYSLVTHDTLTVWNYISNPFVRLIPIIIVAGILIVAALYFRKRSKYFAEEV